MPARRHSRKHKTAQERWLARQATNTRYYAKNRETICESRRSTYKEKVNKKLAEEIQERETRKVAQSVTQESENTPSTLLGSPKRTALDVSSSKEAEATVIAPMACSKPNFNEIDHNATKEAEATASLLTGSSKLSFTELDAALENARKIYDDFEEFRDLEELEEDLTAVVDQMESSVARVRKHSDGDEGGLREVNGYLKEISIWLEDLRGFNRSALWGVDALREDLREGGRIHYLVTQPLTIS
ncbi:hypothetical protein C8R41DRAFT_914603 [Lentinula lateritia]|uniref:Uncharacterized protein n=1 Tax=Lentinula lateritia TaxID=40482 RepID=A0ABQ8VX94_9AGAR|nr:hypothetical protein C8R41DRAFT_914603 [Lentinula lateritia]